MTAKAIAKVEAVAKATYERKKSTTEIIPPDVTRAKAQSWLDLISPLTEWAGLRGDALAYKREQLRLQREDILLEIAKKACARLQVESEKTDPVPNKFLVPFLEKASLEDSASRLCNAWANLFVEAARNFDPKLQSYADILSRISWREAKFLRDVCLNSNYKDGVSWPHGHFQDNSAGITQNVTLLKASSEEQIESCWTRFKDETKLQYGYIIHATVVRAGGAVYFYNREFLPLGNNPSVIFDLLERERLVMRHVALFGSSGSVSYVDLTYLAVDLIRTCTRGFSVSLDE
jgi:hypothetical protein